MVCGCGVGALFGHGVNPLIGVVYLTSSCINCGGINGRFCCWFFVV